MSNVKPDIIENNSGTESDATGLSFEAIEQECWQYKDDLYRYISRIIQPPQDAEDILQDTFLRLTKKPPHKEKKTKLRAYLFVIAANLIKDKLRERKKQYNTEYLDTSNAELSITPNNPELVMVSNQLTNHLLSALDSLDKKYSHVFVMHRYMNYSYQQIADKKRISVRTVERRMSFVLKYLSEKIEVHENA